MHLQIPCRRFSGYTIKSVWVDVIFDLTSSGTYYVTASYLCNSESDTIVVSQLLIPAPFDLGRDTTLCPGESIMLFAPVTGNTIQWQDESTGMTMLVNKVQVYSLTLTNLCCMAEDEIFVSIDSLIPVIDLENFTLCPGGIAVLDASQPYDAFSQWNTGSQLLSIEISSPGPYAVNVRTLCFDIRDEVVIERDIQCGNVMYIPNVFSPNNDGVNDEWVVSFEEGIQVVGMESTICDRWGNMIFLSSDLSPA